MHLSSRLKNGQSRFLKKCSCLQHHVSQKRVHNIRATIYSTTKSKWSSIEGRNCSRFVDQELQELMI
jgi:hypothetical protein